MAEKRAVTDGDRLPWLGSLPERSAAPGPRAAVRGLTIIVVLLAVALAGTLSLLILRQRDVPSAPPASPAAAAKVDLPAAPPPAAAPTPVPVLPPVTAAPAPVAKLAEAPPPRTQAKSAVKKASVRKASARMARAKKAKANQRRAALHPATKPQIVVHRGVRNWPAVPWIGTPGSVIQLGAYASPRQSDIAWRSSIRAYPYLATLPKKVTSVRVGPKRLRYYRLQLGTPSPVHAAQVCRNLRSIRRSCIVA